MNSREVSSLAACSHSPCFAQLGESKIPGTGEQEGLEEEGCSRKADSGETGPGFHCSGVILTRLAGDPVNTPRGWALQGCTGLPRGVGVGGDQPPWSVPSLLGDGSHGVWARTLRGVDLPGGAGNKIFMCHLLTFSADSEFNEK